MSPARYRRSPAEDRTWNGRVYDSKREMADAMKLAVLARHGKIANLREQVRYELIPKQGKERALVYIADFVWEEDGKEIVADSKGHRTEVYIIKRKLMKYLLGIEIMEL
jgi:hypothetical protein